MIKRDKRVLKMIEKFRILNRDHISKMFYSHTKNPATNANYCLKRLRDRGYIKAIKHYNPYAYFLKESKIKTNGQKVDQFLHIADTYLSMIKHGNVQEFEVEPRYKDVSVRADLFAIWKGSMWFVECQNTKFSDKQMSDKIKRYEELYTSGMYKQLPFQRYDKPYMPFILIVGDSIPYNIISSIIKVYQTKTINDFVNKITTSTKIKSKVNNNMYKSNKGVIKVNIT